MELLATPVGRVLRKLRSARAAKADGDAAWSASQAKSPTLFDPVVIDNGHGWEWVASNVPPVIPDDVMRHMNSAISETRTALDALVWARGEQLGLKRDYLNNNSFPVVDHVNAWERRRSEQLIGIDSGFVEMVRDVQPFATPGRPASKHPLQHLSMLSNRDKHKGGIWVVASFVPPEGLSSFGEQIHFDDDEAAMAAAVDKGLTEEDVKRLTFVHHGPIDNGTVVSRVVGPTPGSKVRPDDKPHLELPIGPAIVMNGLDDLAPLQYALPIWINHVEGIVRYITGDRAHPPAPLMTSEAMRIVADHTPFK